MTVKHVLYAAIAALCTSCFVLACAGGVVGFSPVPFWDMWDGTLLFVHKFWAGDWGALWSQHNEHRIILARLLFLIEYSFLGGTGAFLILVSYLLVVLTAITFWRTLAKTCTPTASRASIGIAGFILLAWLSLWTQENNLTWAFQSQFFMAQLFPLWALLLLARSFSGHGKANTIFWAGLLVGVLSAGTMANGLLALPLMVVLAALLGTSMPQLGALVLAAASTITLYLQGYFTPSGHGSLVQSLQSDPIGVLIYTFRYLGSPFYFLMGQSIGAANFSAIAGALLAAASLATAFVSIQEKPRNAEKLALIIFIAYIGASAFMTAGGRLVLGLDTAFASRYTTPAIMAWAALFCIHAKWLLSRIERVSVVRYFETEGCLT